MVDRIPPRELRARLEREPRPLVLDVRTPEEVAFAPFPGAVTVPLDELAGRVGELDREAEIVVVCHHGVRSARAALHLVACGFERVLNLAGGIDAWSEQVDPSVPRY